MTPVDDPHIRRRLTTILAVEYSNRLDDLLDLEESVTTSFERELFESVGESPVDAMQQRLGLVCAKSDLHIASIDGTYHDIDFSEVWFRYLPLAVWLASLTHRNLSGGRATVIGHFGGAGVGKTTSSKVLAMLLTELGKRCATISLDDFYLPKASRNSLIPFGYSGRRGPPGTHDTVLAETKLQEMLTTTADGWIQLPQYDKSIDDHGQTRLIQGGIDLLIFEGCLVGFGTDILDSDAHAISDPYKREVALRLRSYSSLFSMIDCLLARPLLAVDLIMEQFRQQQEHHRTLALVSGLPWKGLSDKDVESHIRGIYVDPWAPGITSPEPPDEKVTLYLDTNIYRQITQIRPGGAFR